MNMLHSILELDLAYLDTFTNRKETSWGHLFFNEEQPFYYDANHAQIMAVPENPEEVIEEVLQFYKNKNLSPRFYLYDFENMGPFIEKLKAYHFKVESLVHPVQLWNRQIAQPKQNDKITIEEVTAANFQEALEIECTIAELGGREVREKSFPVEFKHPAFTHYLLRYDGVACSTACLFEAGKEVRLETVATLAEYRGKGLIGELIYFLQKEVENRGFENFWVFPINERVEKVYLRYGFETVTKLTTGHAYLFGKSIKELQGV